MRAVSIVQSVKGTEEQHTYFSISLCQAKRGLTDLGGGMVRHARIVHAASICCPSPKCNT